MRSHETTVLFSLGDGVAIGSCSACDTSVVRLNPVTGAEEWLDGASPWTRQPLRPVRFDPADEAEGGDVSLSSAIADSGVWAELTDALRDQNEGNLPWGRERDLLARMVAVVQCYIPTGTSGRGERP